MCLQCQDWWRHTQTKRIWKDPLFIQWKFLRRAGRTLKKVWNGLKSKGRRQAWVSLVVAGVGQGWVKISVCKKGIVWCDFPTSAKRGSIHSALSDFPDVGTSEEWGVSLMTVSSQASRNEVRLLVTMPGSTPRFQRLGCRCGVGVGGGAMVFQPTVMGYAT